MAANIGIAARQARLPPVPPRQLTGRGKERLSPRGRLRYHRRLRNLGDLTRRLAKIIVGQTRDGRAVTAGDLKAEGPMAVLLKDALTPNLVQSLEGTPAFVHGGPFANIAHGCNSVIATKMALSLADYVVTEAGFSADLAAVKFFNIKCRKAGLIPAAAALVVSVRALKPIREVRLSNGAEYVVAICGDVMTMPGLPRHPAEADIRLDGDGQVVGLF